MNKPQGILIFGANGSGKTTLARELASILNFRHIDHEDYAFEKSDMPYTKPRSFDECVGLMLADIKESCGFVLSAVTGNFGSEIEYLYGLAVYLEAPLDVRLKRIKQRGYDRYGERALKGGDMFTQLNDFAEFAAKRPLLKIEVYAKTLNCPLIRADGQINPAQTAFDIAKRFYTKPGEEWRVYTAQHGKFEKYRFTVIFARHNGKWIYARHKNRDVYETAGGHIEPGETPLECAKRELYEETGAEKFQIYPAFDYAVHTETGFSYGQVFYADVEKFGKMPDFEMAQVRAFDTIPDKMRFPQILPVLYGDIDKWLCNRGNRI
ncbi:MAG: AAA family ATPase [Clostridiales bacterium]|jgi:energy-coupling factor transporter ATP-binding protein EcfA2|nr:AAA family ATPase [Clostridiales bacterium]